MNDSIVKGDGGSTPSQYALPEGAKEIQDLVEAREMNFAVGNIFKAAYRIGSCSHADRAYDLRKILWFANRELAVCERNMTKAGSPKEND